MSEELVVHIEHLSKSFDKRDVLIDVSLDLRRGENLVVIGRSGVGKSILIKCIIGLVKPDLGIIRIFGNDISKIGKRELDELRKKIGFCFQGSALYDSMSVRENLELPLERNLGIRDQGEKDKLVTGALEDVGLLDAIDLMPAALSGGMRKRLSIARALVLKPELMLYDEPTGGLDPITSTEINHLITRMQRKYDMSSIIITHDITCARVTANRMIFLKDGAFVMQGSFEELLAARGEPTLKAFFDYFKLNELEIN